MALKDWARRNGLDYRTAYQFIKLVADLGILDGIRLILREFGISTYQSVAYPTLNREFRVQFDPVWRWIGRGIRERGVLRFAQDRLKKGDVVFDVGAHVGEYALLFSELVGPSGKVVSFDPDPVACKILRKNLELNKITNVVIEQQCVSNKTGKTSLMAERLGSGLSSTTLDQLALDAHYKTLEVEATTIDDYCSAHDIFTGWVKVDNEGAEPLTIKGMTRLIETHHPSTIIEFHQYNLTAEQREKSWFAITSRATKVQVLESDFPKNYEYLEEIPRWATPKYGFLIVYLQY